MYMEKPKKETVTQEGEYGHSGIDYWRWHQSNHRPSWKRFGSGYAVLSVNSAKPTDGERWLSFNMVESADEGATKQTFVTMNEASARKLLAYLTQEFAE